MSEWSKWPQIMLCAQRILCAWAIVLACEQPLQQPLEEALRCGSIPWPTVAHEQESKQHFLVEPFSKNAFQTLPCSLLKQMSAQARAVKA